MHDQWSRVVAIMPARNSARTLEDTVRAIPPGFFDQIILVDNASKDETVSIAERLELTVVRHPVDRGYGGSLKTCFRTALAADPEYIVELHPDNQYDPRFLPALLERIRADNAVMVIASRFLPPRKALEGGMPWWKYLSNRLLTLLNGVMLGVRLSEFHSGFRVYSAAWIRSIPFESYSNDFKFSFQLIGQAAQDGRRISEIAAFCRYFPEASQNPLRGSIVYGWGTLTESFRVFMTRMGLPVARKPTA
jgi:glycosyltransferase involved in cell wall biosynthesis